MTSTSTELIDAIEAGDERVRTILATEPALAREGGGDEVIEMVRGALEP